MLRPPAPTDTRLEPVLAHRRFIVAYALVILRSLDAAEDVAQEVLLAATEQVDRLPAGEGLVPWLKVVTRHKSLQALERNRRSRPMSPEALATFEAEQLWDAQDDGSAQREAFRRCFTHLAGDAREVVLRRYRDDEPCEAIAVGLGRTVQAVYAILKRARLALGECIGRAHPPTEAR